MATRRRRTVHPLEPSPASRSPARTGWAMPRGNGRMAPGRVERRDRAAMVEEHRLQLARGNPDPRTRRALSKGAAAGREGGPGKRRPTPKPARRGHRR